MIVVSDTTPSNYLILVEAARVLPALFGHVYAPPAVMEELEHPRSSQLVREWGNSAHGQGSGATGSGLGTRGSGGRVLVREWPVRRGGMPASSWACSCFGRAASSQPAASNPP
jgi:hypothetical protein